MEANEETSLRLRNVSKDEQEEEISALIRLNEIKKLLDRLGSGLSSQQSMIHRLREDLLDQENSARIIEKNLMKVEEKFSGKGEMTLNESSIEIKRGNDVDDLFTRQTKTSSSKLKHGEMTLNESSIEIKRGNDVDDHFTRQTKTSSSKLKHGSDLRSKIKSSFLSLDLDLLPVVVQCFMTLSKASHGRQMESSCRLIQRLFRGYIVRKNIEMTEGRSFNVSRLKRSESIVNSENTVEIFNNNNNNEISSSEQKTSMEELRHMTSSARDDQSTVRPDDVIKLDATTENKSNKTKQPRKSSLTQLIQSKLHHHKQQHRGSLSSISSSSSSSSSSLTDKRSWSVSGTTEWNDLNDEIVANIRELRQLQMFLSSKISHLKEISAEKSTIPEIIFGQTLEELHAIMTQKHSKETHSEVIYSYKELMNDFEETLKEKVKQHSPYSVQGFPFPVLINAFRTILTEFLTKKDFTKEIPDAKLKKETKKTKMKKKSTSKESDDPVAVTEGGVDQVKFQSAINFSSSSSSVPGFVLEMMESVESRGLSVVGIYRVAGNAVKIKQLTKDIDSGVSGVDYSVVGVHVITSVLKSFLRNMTQPLIAYDLCEDLVQLSQTVNIKDRTQRLSDILTRLLPNNRELLELLLVHLAKVAMQESSNQMSVNALAIVFTPCVMRLSDKKSLPDQTKSEVKKQIECLQFLIESKLQELKNKTEQGPEMPLCDVRTKTFISADQSGSSNDVIYEEMPDDTVIDSCMNVNCDDSIDSCHVTDNDVFAENYANAGEDKEDTAGEDKDIDSAEDEDIKALSDLQNLSHEDNCSADVNSSSENLNITESASLGDRIADMECSVMSSDTPTDSSVNDNSSKKIDASQVTENDALTADSVEENEWKVEEKEEKSRKNEVSSEKIDYEAISSSDEDGAVQIEQHSTRK